MRLIRKFGTFLTLLATLSVAAWSTGCGQKTGPKTKAKTPVVKDNHDHSKDASRKQKTGKDGKAKISQVTIPGTVDDNPDGIGSGTGVGIKLEDLDK